MKRCDEQLPVPAHFHPTTIVRRALATILFLSAVFLHAAEPPTPYDAWIKPWTNRAATSPALGEARLRAIVSIVSGEAEFSAVTNMTPVERLRTSYQIRVAATEVATNGTYRNYFVSNTDARTTRTREFSQEEFQKLNEALALLPEDNSQLPLAGRRVVVQIWENNQWRVRVYDGNKPPPEVKSLLNILANPADQLL
jgi:hypothetical protein